MYAIFEDGSRQYRAEEGALVIIDHREIEIGATIELNQILLIDRVVGPEPGSNVVVFPVQWVTDGKTNEVNFGFESPSNPSAVANPGELVVRDGTVIIYSILPIINARTVFFPKGATNLTVKVPAQRALRFFQPIGYDNARARLQRSTQIAERFEVRGGDVIDGPIDISFLPIPGLALDRQPSLLITYLENDAVALFPTAAAPILPANCRAGSFSSATN